MAEDTKEILAQNAALAKLIASRERDLEIQKKLDQVAKNRISSLKRESDFYEDQAKFYRETNVAITSYVENIKAAAEADADRLGTQQLLETVQARASERLRELTDQTEALTEAEEKEVIQLELMKEACDEGIESVEGLQAA